MPFDEGEQILFVQRLEAVQPCERTDQTSARRIAPVKPEFVKDDPFPGKTDPAGFAAGDQTRSESILKGKVFLFNMMESCDGSAVFPEDLADGEAGKQSAHQIFDQFFEGFGIVAPSVESFELQLLENPESVYAQAVDLKPAVKSALLNLEYAEVNIARAKGAYLPSLSLTGGIGTNYYTTSRMSSDSFADQMKNNFSQYVGLSLSIPIFARFSTRNSVRNAELSYENQQLQLESVKKSLYKEIQQAYYNAVAAQSKYSSSLESAESARLHYELTDEKYRAGKADIADYNDARNSWLSAESDFVRSKYECLFQTRLLDFYKGEAIVF